MVSVWLGSFMFTVVLGPPSLVGARIAESALDQTTWNTRYDPAYVRLAYPNGDVPKNQGVCTDVVIRSLRSVGYDLQKLIHEDARKFPQRYPRISKLDRNIDHRRCPNQIAYFRAYGKSFQPSKTHFANYLPGDFVFWKLDNGLDHVGVVTGTKSGARPWVVHNLGGTRHEDVLTEWKLVGHFRFPKP